MHERTPNAPKLDVAHFLLIVAAIALLALAACSSGPTHEGRSSTTGGGLASSYCGGHLPDPNFSPGSLCTAGDPNFDGYRYPEGVPHCRRNVSAAMKAQIAAYYGVPMSEYSRYEFDHYIPLGIGGSSNIDNVWPQILDEAREKDVLENQLYQQMRSGSIVQADAVAQIYAWRPSGGVPPDCGGGGPPTGCAHDICTSGGALDPNCDPCVAQICASDAYCCNNHWSYICVNEVASICGQTCP